jgi:glycosyltransferase involved in cell wall biosynthesis
MRLAFLSGEYHPEPGGVGDYTRQLAVALRACGHEVSTLTVQGGRMLIYGAGDAPLPVAGTHGGLDWSPRCWPAVIVALRQMRPDWLHIQYQTGAYAMRPGINFLPWRLRGLPGRPRVAVTFHDLRVPYLFPKAGPLRAWVNRRLAADADAVVTTNAADARGLAGLSPKVIPIGSNIPVAPPPGFSRASWREALGVEQAELLVGFFGLLSPSKGADLLIEALAGLAYPWRLLLIGGEAPLPSDQAHAAALRARIAALGLGERVITTGQVAADVVSAHLLATDLVVLPFRDGASFRRGSLLAALAHGCAVVTTQPTERAEATLLAPAAALVAPSDVRALAAALAQLAANPATRSALAAAGPLLAKRFSWAEIAARHEALYSC